MSVRLVVVALVGAMLLAACGSAGSPAPSRAPSSAAATAAASGAGGGVTTASTCTTLKSLRDVDYAFGKNFTITQQLPASSVERTLANVTAFQAVAPVELRQAAAELVTFWTGMKANASAISPKDPHWLAVNDTFPSWIAAHC